MYPRSYHDYDAIIHVNHVPKCVEVGFKEDAFGDIVWNQLPENEEWFKNE